jgi:hypothetical protein
MKVDSSSAVLDCGLFPEGNRLVGCLDCGSTKKGPQLAKKATFDIGIVTTIVVVAIATEFTRRWPRQRANRPKLNAVRASGLERSEWLFGNHMFPEPWTSGFPAPALFPASSSPARANVIGPRPFCRFI